MRMQTDTYQVLTFDELSEAIQDKVVEKHFDFNVSHDWWEGDWHLGLSTAEMKARRITMSDKLARTGLFSWDKMYFDGVGYSQNRYIQFPDLEVNCEETFRKFLRIPKRLWEVCTYEFETPAGWGYNAGTTVLVIESDKWDERLQDYTDFTEHQQEIVDNAMGIMNEKIEDALTGLQKEYEYLTSREQIIESLKTNDYEFPEDGEIA